jgi:hypothetical protein
MQQRVRVFTRAVLLCAATALFLPAAALAQEGTITGVVRDASGAVLPGVTVEVRSPALIEGVRTTTTEGNGQYRLLALPVGTYEVRFSLPSFSTVRRENIGITTGFTATVNAEMRVGEVTEEVTVIGESPTVDVQNARQVTTFTGEDLRDLPTARNVSSLIVLVPGITTTGFGGNFAQGLCPGGAGVFCNPNVNNFNAHTGAEDGISLTQGRLQVDGMVVNTASTGMVTGAIGGYLADVANAQEVSFNLTGALGESETGGTSINIVPRTGGNRYAGNYITTYSQDKWWDRNNRTRTGAQPNLINYDYDVSGAFGGPILRDRLWFYSVGRSQGKESGQTGGPFYYNLNAGVWGANYLPDRERGPVYYTNVWRNVSTRLTLQATPRNKFNIFWDEQDSCQDPCDGVVSVYTSPESWWSVQTRPNRLQQLTWTNPFSNRILLEGGLNIVAGHYDFSRHRYIDNPQHIPRVTETGNNVGMDHVATRVNAFAGGAFWPMTTGSIPSGRVDNLDNYRTRGSVSYITGSHNAKMGYEGQYYSQIQNVFSNGPRMTFTYSQPGTACLTSADPLACGNTSLYFPEDPDNRLRRPVPSNFQINTGPRSFDEKVWTHSFYLQDQWTLNRFTLNGALRYDNARSKYNPTCVGPDVFVVEAYCTPAQDGVNFHNISPRWGVAWDVFGTGRTAIKWNMGKYVSAAGFHGIYTGVNPARRTQNTLNRSWQDLNGNRYPDCEFLNFTAHDHLGDTCNAPGGGTAIRFGRDPYGLDDAGLPIGLQTTQCGRTETGIPDAVQEYCARSGQNLLSGWNKRRETWQFGLGIQRELLPRLSAEVTFNQRWTANQLVSDSLGVGCDFYQDNTDQCMADLLNYQSDQQSFYMVQAPLDPRLPNGGGYWITGLNNRSTVNAVTSLGTAQTNQNISAGWKGVDTNFILRARGGLRLNGGTSTGASYGDNCAVMNDNPSLRQREGNSRPACNPRRPFQTQVRGSASYTVPFVDVLVSTVFQSRPGPAISANYQFNLADVVWMPGSEWRATNTAGCPTAFPTGCLYPGNTGTQSPTINLLDTGDMYGSRYQLIDLKFAKNIRFARRRVNLGVDIYNVFNSDAIIGYSTAYNPVETHDPDGNPIIANAWRSASTLVPPRYARFSVQFDF